MTPNRRRGILQLGLACFEAALSHRTEHRPTAESYPDSVVRRTSFAAGGGLGWRIAALETPRETPAPWKIVVITGAPSWAEYWAPVMAALPQHREMVVVSRPGFGASEPFNHVGDIRTQAAALSPVLDGPPSQKVLLVGQSYGAPIAVLMAAARRDRVAGVALLSSFLGEAGPTARWLVDVGSKLLTVIPRDLRNAVLEVSGQAAQLVHMRTALERVQVPIHVFHGDQDDFAPIELAERLARETRSRRPIRFQTVPGADHFMTDGPVEPLIAYLESCIASAPAPWRLPPLALPRLNWPSLRRVRPTPPAAA